MVFLGDHLYGEKRPGSWADFVRVLNEVSRSSLGGRLFGETSVSGWKWTYGVESFRFEVTPSDPRGFSRLWSLRIEEKRFLLGNRSRAGRHGALL